jgi:hypothetical protein
LRNVGLHALARPGDSIVSTLNDMFENPLRDVLMECGNDEGDCRGDGAPKRHLQGGFTE